jgi:hypothetical protein
MKRSPMSKRSWLLLSTAALVCGQVLALLPSCETALTTLNPCGSIFGFCEPTDIDLMFAEVPDFDLDPSCTIPYYGTYGETGAGGGGGGAALGNCATTPVYPFTPGSRPGD